MEVIPLMEMTLRWYGSKFDTVTLSQIRQIPGVTGVITTYTILPRRGLEQRTYRRSESRGSRCRTAYLRNRKRQCT